jgi:hypothetical protein
MSLWDRLFGVRPPAPPMPPDDSPPDVGPNQTLVVVIPSKNGRSRAYVTFEAGIGYRVMSESWWSEDGYALWEPRGSRAIFADSRERAEQLAREELVLSGNPPQSA